MRRWWWGFRNFLSGAVLDHRGFAVHAQDGDVESGTAPHMFRQQAREMRTWAGSLWEPKYSNSSSHDRLDHAGASMAGVWQWTQPWVWTMLVMPAPVPPKGRAPLAARAFFRGSILDSSLTMNSTLCGW